MYAPADTAPGARLHNKAGWVLFGVLAAVLLILIACMIFLYTADLSEFLGVETGRGETALVGVVFIFAIAGLWYMIAEVFIITVFAFLAMLKKSVSFAVVSLAIPLLTMMSFFHSINEIAVFIGCVTYFACLVAILIFMSFLSGEYSRYVMGVTYEVQNNNESNPLTQEEKVS